MFSLGDFLLAVPVGRLRELGEVPPAPRLAPLPLVPAWVRGLANLRGDLLVVVDLLPFLGAGELPDRPSNRLLVLGRDTGEAWACLLAGTVHGMASAPLEAAGGAPRPLAGFLQGVLRHELGEAGVLDVDRLMETLRETTREMN